jgi:squalene-hopene/tetraprenyl-beta-curcumene cyclase
VFLVLNSILHKIEDWGWLPFREQALKRAEEWMVERNGEGSDGLGAIFPSMLNTLFAMKCLGYSDEDPLLRKAEKHFMDLQVFDTEKDDYRIQPCFSPVWDTAITSFAMMESGVAKDDPRMIKTADWLMKEEIKIRSDWKVKNPYPEASGWAFEYNNVHYPDVDDSFKVIMALEKMQSSDEEKKKKLLERAIHWARSFQCKNGGFAAFDKDCTKEWLNDVPFADHNAILDPPCSDITARGLECMAQLGMTNRNDPIIKKALKYLKKTQEEDGSWYGRWGVNYIYGTWLALRGLKAMGEDMNQDWVIRARDWVESCQNPDGGWGETVESYRDPELKGKGESTASQTAWALMAIMACGDVNRETITNGIKYLIKTQSPHGDWPETLITGTGFPNVFYLRYDMYRNNWPLLALADYHNALKKATAA